MGGIVRSVVPDTGMDVVYDLDKLCVVNDLTDYSIWLKTKKRLDAKTVRQDIGHLVAFYAYLRRQKRDPSSIGDAFIHKWVNSELASVAANPRARNSELAARTTVNQKTSAILHWLFWMQLEGRCSKGTIGPVDCRVTASLKSRRSSWHRPRKSESRLESNHFLRGAAACPFVPPVSREIYDKLCDHIQASALSTYIAQRDRLFVDVAASAGFRRGSICSLSIGQIDARYLRETAEMTAKLKPAAQKFGYEHVYDVDTLLLLRVLDFIEGPRARLLSELNVTEAIARGQIFLSARTGKPMTDRAMTARISTAMRAIGCAKGQAIHVFRGLYVNEIADDEIEDRLEAGLDTSTASIVAAVAPRVGQKNPASLFAYISGKQTEIARRRRAARRRQCEGVAADAD